MQLSNEPYLLSADYLRFLSQVEPSEYQKKIEAMGPPSHAAFAQDQERQSIAVLPISGPITKGGGGLFAMLFGGVSSVEMGHKFTEALEDDGIQAIVFSIDSPGGEVAGTQELAQMIFQARGRKPIVSFVNGQMSSAAYWIGAAADQVFISGDTNAVGSIGVVATHVDTSKAEEAHGVKVTEIIAGKFKRVGSQHGPLSAGDRGVIQERLDAVYAAFIKDVAEFRGQSESFVLDRMADGRIFIGKDAIERKLVDGAKSFRELASGFSFSTNTEVSSMGDPVKTYTETDLKAEYEKGLAEGKALGIEEGKVAGSEGERARIKAVEEQAMVGHEALIDSLKFDGKTTGDMAAVQVLKAVKADGAKHLENIHSDTPENLPPHSEAKDPTGATGEAKKEELIQARMNAANCSYQEAAVLVASENRELFL